MLLGREPLPLEIIVAAGLGGLTAQIVEAIFEARSRDRTISLAEKSAAELLESPVESAMSRARSLIEQTELARLWSHFESLLTSHRNTLASLLEARQQRQEALAQLEKAELAPGAMDRRFLGPAHIVVGSSRNRMVARLAPNLNVMAATQPLCRFFGQTTQSLLGAPVLSIIHQDDQEVLRKALSEALRDGEAHNVVVRGPADQFLQLDVITCYDENGRPLHLRCHFLDITQRIRTERELVRITREVSEANSRLREANQDLERLKESYRDLYHFAPVLYFSLDPEGRLVAFNETTLRVLGYGREALLGKPYTTLLPAAEREEFDLATLQRPGEVESRWVKCDGTEIDVWIGTTIIRDLKGAFLRSRSAARDVTETRRLADALRAKNDELLRINQELEEFTYVVSHDLKEPLRTLEAFSTFLAQDYGEKLAEDGQEYIRHLVQASRRLGKLIDDLLVLSRTGRVINSPRPFDWGPAIATVLGDLHGLIQKRQARVHAEGRLPPCLGDPERIGQLLANLIGNGLKYNKNEHPEVVIGARPVSLSDTQAVLYVRDNGEGIDPQHHEQIFRIFRRLHRNDEVEGTGAGLAICKRIVEAHGGRIWVESRPGEGATFLFTLPLARKHLKEGAPDVQALAAG
jgi:PAS domain S-box-containing protein